MAVLHIAHNLIIIYVQVGNCYVPKFITDDSSPMTHQFDLWFRISWSFWHRWNFFLFFCTWEYCTISLPVTEWRTTCCIWGKNYTMSHLLWIIYLWVARRDHHQPRPKCTNRFHEQKIRHIWLLVLLLKNMKRIRPRSLVLQMNLFQILKYWVSIILEIRVVGKGSWKEREMRKFLVGKSEVGKFLFKLERA